jgi:small subunit ribosomal protein S21
MASRGSFDPRGGECPGPTPEVRPVVRSRTWTVENFYHDWGDQPMAGIRVKEGESFEGALKRFKKKCEKAGILSDLRRHQYFEKPSERKKRKEAAARRKMLKNQALQRD